ncbi:DnaJ domain-containing protein [Patescibacteria group bacterium]|nr:DnaJ domain-containing protein [Patescibacteria group bacterium]
MAKETFGRERGTYQDLAYDAEGNFRGDAYRMLGISEDAGLDEIEKAWRKAAKLYHTDRPNGNEEKFNLAWNFYKILKDPYLRAQYDQDRRAKKRCDSFREGKYAPSPYRRTEGPSLDERLEAALSELREVIRLKAEEVIRSLKANLHGGMPIEDLGSLAIVGVGAFGAMGLVAGGGVMLSELSPESGNTFEDNLSPIERRICGNGVRGNYRLVSGQDVLKERKGDALALIQEVDGDVLAGFSKRIDLSCFQGGRMPRFMAAERPEYKDEVVFVLPDGTNAKYHFDGYGIDESDWFRPNYEMHFGSSSAKLEFPDLSGQGIECHLHNGRIRAGCATDVAQAMKAY